MSNTIKDYRSHEGVNFSALKMMEYSPAHFYEAWKNDLSKQTTETKIGTALHCSILQPEIFEQNYISFSGDLRSSAANTLKKSLQDNQQILKNDEHDLIVSMKKSVLSNSMAKALLTLGIAETPIFWTDPETNIVCKALPDFVSTIQGKQIVVDVKTTICARKNEFTRSCYTYRYYQQLAWYKNAVEKTTGKEVDGCVLIAIEKAAPFACAVYYASEHMLAAGEAQNTRNLKKVAECLETNNWPSYTEGFEEIDLPTYAGDIL